MVRLSLLLNTALAMPLVSPLCQKPPSPITLIARLGTTAPKLAALAAPRGGTSRLGSGPSPAEPAPKLAALAAPRGGASRLGSGPSPAEPAPKLAALAAPRGGASRLASAAPPGGL